MSGSSSDQLYISLRPATLKWRLETSQSTPFIVDDILGNFANARQNIKGIPTLLEGAEFVNVNLQGADLSEVDLADAELWKSN